ncbi:MAG: hypothetical protein JW850_21790 [Thermoflexales bacterium]|nr:hypothetical protein [Thermoflexales bacterium]
MKHSGGITIVMLVLALVAGSCVISSMAGYSWNLDSNGLRVGNPVNEAQAIRVVMEAADKAAAREIERQVTQAAAPILVLRSALVAIEVGVAALVGLVGLVFVGLACLAKQATTIYPDGKGQYPLIIRRGFGWEIIHDPSRNLDPGAVYRVPTMLDITAEIMARLRGRPSGLPQVVGEYLPSGSEPAQLQAALSSNAVSLAAAQNRWPDLQISIGRAFLGGRGSNHVQPALPEVHERMPQITVIDDPKQIADYRQYVLETAG